jgi:hypothetical protein
VKTLKTFDACYGSVPQYLRTPLPSPSLFCWRAVKAAVSLVTIVRLTAADVNPRAPRCDGGHEAGTDQHNDSSTGSVSSREWQGD